MILFKRFYRFSVRQPFLFSLLVTVMLEVQFLIWYFHMLGLEDNGMANIIAGIKASRIEITRDRHIYIMNTGLSIITQTTKYYYTWLYIQFDQDLMYELMKMSISYVCYLYFGGYISESIFNDWLTVGIANDFGTAFGVDF